MSTRDTGSSLNPIYEKSRLRVKETPGKALGGERREKGREGRDERGGSREGKKGGEKEREMRRGRGRKGLVLRVGGE